MNSTRPGRWNLLNSRIILSTVILGWAVVFIIRPHLPDMLPGYAQFPRIMPMSTWIVWAVLAWIGMLTAPRLSIWQRASMLGASIYFFLVAGTVAAGIGLTPAVWTAAVEGIAGAAMFGQAQAEAMSHSKLFQRLAASPPETWFKGKREEKHGRK